MEKYYASVCAIVKNETDFLEEWIQYHTLIGFESFVIYDNESSVPVKETLQDYLAEGLLTVVEVSGVRPQLEAYQHYLDKFGHLSRWTAFLDLDEFIVLHNDTCIQALLADFEPFGGLTINWVLFGSNGYIHTPAPPLTAKLTSRFELFSPQHCTVKSIVQPKHVRSVSANPHQFLYKAGQYCVNETKTPVNGPYSPISVDRIQLNHYVYRSQKCYQDKIERNVNDPVAAIDESGWIKFFKHFQVCVHEDKSILKNKNYALLARHQHDPRFFAAFAKKHSEHKHLFQFAEHVSSLLYAQNFDEALKVLCRADLLFPSNVYILLLKARCFLEKGMVQSALQFVNASLTQFQNDEEYPYTLEAYPLLNEIYKRQNRPDKALGVLQFLKKVIAECRHHGIEVPSSIQDFVQKPNAS